MKYLLISIGSRGDVEPFLAVGELLRKNRHVVICQFPEQFIANHSKILFVTFGSMTNPERKKRPELFWRY